MNKLTKAALTGVAALGLIGGGLVAGGAPSAEAAGGKIYKSYSQCKYASADMKMSGVKVTTDCKKIPYTPWYLLQWK